MKKNRSIIWLLSLDVLFVKNPGPNTSPQMKQCLACAVHFHTSFQMFINHFVLRGLVNPDKEVEITRLEDKDGDPQDSVIISIRKVLSKHKIIHLPLWQLILQNNNRSWWGYYLNGQKCKRHKGAATDWLGCVAAYLWFHLLK
jgi:hypothetical protein